MCTTRRASKSLMSVSTMKQVMPPRPFSASVRANTRPKSALSAPEMNTLEPLMTQSLPSFTARVLIAQDGCRRRLGRREKSALRAQHRVQVALLLLRRSPRRAARGRPRRIRRSTAHRGRRGAVHLHRHQRARRRDRRRRRRTPPGCRGRRSPIALHLLVTSTVALLRRQLARVGIKLAPPAARSPRARTGAGCAMIVFCSSVGSRFMGGVRGSRVGW